MELAVRLGEEPLEIAKPLEVMEQDGDAVEADVRVSPSQRNKIRSVVDGRNEREA